MSLTATLFLVGSALAGAALVRRACGRGLDRAEQVLWGTVAGWMLATVSAYALARAAGRLSTPHMRTLTVALAFVALVAWLPSLVRRWRGRAGSQPRAESEKFRGAGLVLALALFAPAYWQLFGTHMLASGEGGVYSGGSTWYDLGFHTAI
ncbi:MAG TPA: hypothetical protein VFX96_14830, partial [Pyrinomonadaceae bacterium]|nr:hypothetical protein [Pyrinomonadaceae bacterium]